MLEPAEYELELLKRQFPREYFAMQCEDLAVALEALALKAEIVVDESAATITVSLNERYELKLSPASPGYEGLVYWYRWRTISLPDGKTSARVCQLRCSAQLIAPDGDENGELNLTVPVDGRAIRDVIREATALLGQVAGLNLLPLPRLHR